MLALVFEGLGADPVKARAQVLATSSPLALKLKAAWRAPKADAAPGAQLPVCVMLGLLRAESALLSPDVPPCPGDALYRMWSQRGLPRGSMCSLRQDNFSRRRDPMHKDGKSINASHARALLQNTIGSGRDESEKSNKNSTRTGQRAIIPALTGSIQEFVDCVPKTVKLPIRWPYSSLLDEALAVSRMRPN